MKNRARGHRWPRALRNSRDSVGATTRLRPRRAAPVPPLSQVLDQRSQCRRCLPAARADTLRLDRSHGSLKISTLGASSPMLGNAVQDRFETRHVRRTVWRDGLNAFEAAYAPNSTL